MWHSGIEYATSISLLCASRTLQILRQYHVPVSRSLLHLHRSFPSFFRLCCIRFCQEPEGSGVHGNLGLGEAILPKLEQEVLTQSIFDVVVSGNANYCW
jgi:hypothetical protein